MIGLVLVAWLAGCGAPPRDPGCATPKAAGRVRNLIVVLADDLGYGDLGATGAKDWRTPHLDALAASGVLATQCYAAQPVCSASRAALLTGCYPGRIGIRGALGPADRVGLAPEEQTLAELARDAGMRTALHGKWHLGRAPAHLPTRHGFEEWSGVPYSHDMWPRHPETPEAYPSLPSMEGDVVTALDEDPSVWTARLRERALEYIEARSKERFLLYLPLPMPHVPLGASAPFRGRSGGGPYGDAVEELDELVGALRRRLEDLAIDDETLLIVTSDNGPWLSYGTHAGSTGGLREGKGSVWEGGVRVPFVAACPGVLPAGRRVDAPFMLIDVLPTCVEALGWQAPRLPIDGGSAWSLLRGTSDAPPHELLAFWYGDNELQAVRSGRWKLVYPHHYRKMPTDLPRPTDGRPWANQVGTVVRSELYDLLDDPGETHDLAYDHPELVRRIDDLAEGLRAELGDSLRGRQGAGRREPAREP